MLDSGNKESEAASTSQSKHSSAAKADVSGVSSELATPLNFGGPKSSLPRWAQSIAGSDFTGDLNKKSAADDSNASHVNDMQNIFEQNLKERGDDGIRAPMDLPLPSAAPQRIDMTEAEGEDELQLLAADNDDGLFEALNDDASVDDDKITQHRSSQFERVYGLGGNESNISSDLRRSRDWFSKKSGTKARQSIAGKFRLRKDTEGQLGASAVGQSSSIS